MIKTIRKILVGCLSILSVTTLVWVVILTNPSLSYANVTMVDQVAIYHNEELQIGTEAVVRNALETIKTSEIYDPNLNIQLCLNDNGIYPSLHPIPGGTAYAFLNKTVVYACEPNFQENTAEFKWEMNNYELRKYNLTVLLAHEFTHNLQHNSNWIYHTKNSFGQIQWKFEGHADYIARGFKNDGLLKDKIEIYLTENSKEHVGVPVFELEDGTIQNISYFKYALVVQYLMEEKGMNYQAICDLDPSIDQPFAEMINWSKK